MKVAITGGHLSPALAVIEELKKDKNTKIVFYGRKHPFENDTALSFEYRTIKKMKISFRSVETGKIKRHLSIDTIPSLFRIPKGVRHVQRKIREENPDVLLTFGGFLALPVAVACYLQKIPIVTHEQTQHAGLANKIIGKFAQVICISFGSSKKYFPKDKVILTGNPIRPEVFRVMRKILLPKDEKVIYITGGSTGAHSINVLVEKTLPQLLKLGAVIHQTGDTTLTGDYERLQKLRNTLTDIQKDRYVLKKFVGTDEVGWIYKNADGIVSRAGINTVLELIATHSTALLLPLKVGQKNEQLENAKLYKATGLGTYRQKTPTSEEFVAEVVNLLEKKRERKDVRLDNIHKNAAKNIAHHIRKIYEEKGKKTA